MGEVPGNILSLAMVEGAIESNRTGRRIPLDAILSAALDDAVDGGRTAEVGPVLKSWQVGGGYQER